MTDHLIDVDERRDRSTVAGTLRSLADQLEGGSDLTLTAGAETVTLSVPDHLGFELEAERDEDDGFEVEIELSWDGDEVAEESNEVGEAAETTAERGTVGPSSEAQEVLSQGQFQVYRDRAEEWRWRLVHRNGNVIADSGEGYSSRQNAEKGLRSVMKNAPGAEVTRVE